ncbi:transposable element Tc1 transposase [Trichonephila clavipes]|nr:transposable element Tc1 transposase [Trichonephila clavipes]
MSFVQDGSEQWSRDRAVSRRPGFGMPWGTTERKDRCIRRTTVPHCTASAAEIRAAVDTTVTQQTVRHQLLQGHLRVSYNVARIPLTPRHCFLQRQWCEGRTPWKTEWRSVVYSDESRFCLGAIDGRMLVIKRPGEHLQPKCLRPRQTGYTSEVKVWRTISYGRRSILRVILSTLAANLCVTHSGSSTYSTAIHEHQGGTFQQNKALPHNAVVTKCALQSVHMLPRPVRSPHLSPIEQYEISMDDNSGSFHFQVLPSQFWHKYKKHRTPYHKVTFGTCMKPCKPSCIQNSEGYTSY